MPLRNVQVRSYRELRVWGTAMDLVVESYPIVRLLPTAERLDLASQMRRATVSVVANIAEGHGRRSPREFLRYLSIANGSRTELETHFDVAERIGYVSGENLAGVRDTSDHVGRMLTLLMRSLS